jgi:uncharacterized protein YkwD
MRIARRLLLVIVVVVTLLVPLATPAVSSAATKTAVLTTLNSNEHRLLDLINSARAHYGLPALHVQSPLISAARAHSREMLKDDYFSHRSITGLSPATRVVRSGYSLSGYRSWVVGENIGLGLGALGTPQAIFAAWMHSPAHRANILSRRFRDVGLGEVSGTFDGYRGVLMYTVDFGERVK